MIRSKVIAFGAAAALLIAASAAMATDVHGSAGIGGQITVYTGSVTSTAGSFSSGSSIAATEVVGTGSSFQQTVSHEGATAFAGGSVGKTGVSTSTDSTQFATVNSYGSVTGNAPLGDTTTGIINGTGGLGKGDSFANSTGTFGIGAIGGSLSINGFAAFH